MNTSYATRKSNTNGYTMKHQQDVYSEAKEYSVWQGYVVVIGLLGVAAGIIYFISQIV
jgi:hypothetical protein